MSDEPPPDADRVGLHATASDHARINQAGRDMHVHYEDGTSEVRRVASEPVEVQCPYPGLAAFGPAQARWFFGRDTVVAELVERVAEQLADGGLLMLVAPSGAGKSSVLRAGLLPAIDRKALPVPGSSGWPRRVCTPTASPLPALAAQLAPLLDRDSGSVTALLAADPGQVIVLLREALRAGHGGATARLVLVVDQLEELFTLCGDEAQRRAFIGVLARLAASAGDGQPPVAVVVCGLRSDFYTPCADHPVLREALQRGQVFLGPMSQEQSRAAILFPARAVGLEIEPGLVELLLSELSPASADEYGAGRLPLLAHALRGTWQQRHGVTLTVAGYRATGGIHRAVATSAERVFTGLSPAAQDMTRRVFLRLIKIGDPGEGIEDTSRRATRAHLFHEGDDPGVVSTVLDVFTQSRLLTQEQDTVEIAHEALLSAWPRLRGWIAEDRGWLLVRQSLSLASRAWIDEGRDPSGLYHGPRLSAARTALADPRADLSPVEVEFLRASINSEDNDDRARRRRVWVLRGLAAALALLLVVVVGVVVSVVQARANAAQLARNTVSQRLAGLSANALGGLGSLPTAVDLRALAAWQTAPTPEARGALLSADETTYAGLLPDSGHDPIVSLAATSDGRLVAVGDDDCVLAQKTPCGTLRVWNTVTRRELVDRTYPAFVSGVAFSPNGATMVVTTAGSQFQVQVWNTRTMRPDFTLGSGFGSAVAFSPDGSTVAVANAGTVVLWNVASRAVIASLPTGELSWSLAFSPNGKLLAAGEGDGSIRLWNTANATAAGVLTGHTAQVRAVAFSPDSATLASASQDGTVRTWNVATMRQKALLLPPSEANVPFDAVAFTPDGNGLLAGGTDAQIHEWDLATGEDVRHSTYDGTNRVTGIAVVAGVQGMTFSGYGDGDVLVQRGDYEPEDENDATAGAAISASRNAIATGSFDGRISVSDSRTLRPLTTLAAGTAVDALAFAPDGAELAASGNGQVTVWNSTSWAVAHALPLATSHGDSLFVNQLQYSANGAFLAAQLVPATGAANNALAASSIEVWSTSTWRPVLTVQSGQSPAAGLLFFALAPNGTSMAVTDGSDIQLWDLATGRQTASWSTGGDASSVLAFVPGSQNLIAGNADGTLSEWDTVRHVRVRRFLGASSGVHALGVSPDGSMVAVGGQDPLISVYSLADGSLIATLQGDTQRVNSLVFNPAADHLLSTADDGSAIWWNLDPAMAVQDLCTAVRGPGLAAAWNQLAQDVNADIGPLPC